MGTHFWSSLKIRQKKNLGMEGMNMHSEIAQLYNIVKYNKIYYIVKDKVLEVTLKLIKFYLDYFY